MFDGEMVKRNFPFEKKFGQKFLVQDNVGDFWSKTNLENFWSKTKLDLENFHHISFLAKSLKCHV